jgi:asparagine synthase (glutamine-hydrolysing)
MCGIAGFTSPGADAGTVMGAMLAAIAHRGPDGAGQFVDRAVAFGHVRLAIVDLAGGAQPRVDKASGDALIFNGEIYGFREQAAILRRQGVPLADHSDTEVLFHLLRLHGVAGACARIDGMFAFAFRDGATGDVHLVRDRFGEKPLYYGVHGGQLVFGSEASAVLAHPGFADAAADIAAAYQLLHFEYLPGTASGWTGIRKVPPATILTFHGGRVSTARYWQPPPAHRGGAAGADAVDRLDALFKDAIRKQIIADVELGVFLSGGLDSSLIAAITAREAPDSLALTVRVGGDGYDETPYAEQAARHIGIRHEIITCGDADWQDALDGVTTHLSEPLADSSLLPTWLVCRAARRSMKVALGGDGADELFAGYPNFQAQRLAGIMQHIPAGIGTMTAAAAERAQSGAYMSLAFRLAQLSQGFGHAPHRQSFHWMAPFGSARMASLWTPGVLPHGTEDGAFAPIDAAAAESGAGGPARLLHQMLMTYLPDDILTKTDRAAMFNGLEVRAPFLDRAFADVACTLPIAAKHRGGNGKFVLKQLARRYLPDSIVDRKKHGFGIPIGALMRNQFRARVTDTLLSAGNPVAPWFNRATLETLLRAHMSGEREHGKRLWALFILFTVSARHMRHASAQRAQAVLHV